MTYFLALALVLVEVAPSQPRKDLNSLVTGIDRTFAGMRDFSADFNQTFKDSLNRTYEESGHLYLMKSRMMRWEYRVPEEKLFVSDGKTVYFYVPGDRLVNKDKVGDAIDERMPLMFLLGRSNLRNEFANITIPAATPTVPGAQVLRMVPKRQSDLKEIEMEVDPTSYHILRLVLVYTDGSRSEFKFSNIQTNTGLKASLFDFKVPAGVEVREGIGQ